MFLNEIFQSFNPIAFTLGPLTVRWYGLAYLAGFIVAGFVQNVFITWIVTLALLLGTLFVIRSLERKKA